MKQTFTPSKLVATFEQRAGSKLRAHERRWRLRTDFEASGMCVWIRSDTRLEDLHTLFNAFAVVIVIGELRQEFPLREVLAEAAAKKHPYLIECGAAKEIRIGLKGLGRHHRLEGYSILPRAHDGRGFAVMLELHGRRLISGNEICKNENGSRPDSQKRKAPIHSRRLSKTL